MQRLPTAAAHKSDTVLDGITLAAVRPSVSQSLRQRISQTQSLLAPLADGTFNACATGKTAASMDKWPPSTLQLATSRESRVTAQSPSTSSDWCRSLKRKELRQEVSVDGQTVRANKKIFSTINSNPTRGKSARMADHRSPKGKTLGRGGGESSG